MSIEERRAATTAIKGRTDKIGADETGTYEVDNPNHAGKTFTVYRLRHLGDGHCRDFVDDGTDLGGAPYAGRQSLIHAVQKRTHTGLPIFFFDKACPTRLPIQVATDEVRAAMDENLSARGIRREAAMAAKQVKMAEVKDGKPSKRGS